MGRFLVSSVYYQQNLHTESICIICVICLAIKLIVLDVYTHSQDEEIFAGNRGKMNNTTFCAQRKIQRMKHPGKAEVTPQNYP